MFDPIYECFITFSVHIPTLVHMLSTQLFIYLVYFSFQKIPICYQLFRKHQRHFGHKMNDPSHQNKRVFVGNVPVDSNPMKLRLRFSAHGRITNMGENFSKGFTFIQVMITL